MNALNGAAKQTGNGEHFNFADRDGVIPQWDGIGDDQLFQRAGSEPLGRRAGENGVRGTGVDVGCTVQQQGLDSLCQCTGSVDDIV